MPVKRRTASRPSPKSSALNAKMERVLSTFGKLSAPERRQFINAVSDLTQKGPAKQPTKQKAGDYFRRPRNQPGSYKPEPDASISADRVQLSVRTRVNPIKGLTFERLVSYLDQWRLGFFRMAGMMWDTMERRDYQLQIVRPKRLKSVARHGYEVLTVQQVKDDQKALAEQQQEFLHNFWDNVTVTTALNPDEEGGASLLVRQMMDAVGKFYAVHEIVWEPMPDGSLTAKFIHCPIWWFEGTSGKLRFLQSEFQIYGVDMLPGEWLVTCGDGIMEACSVIYLMKYLPLKSWITFLDKFAMPGIHGKTDAQKGSGEWNDFVDAVQDFGEEFAVVTNRNGEISLIEAGKSSGDGGYEKIIQMMDRKITQLWRGGDLGTESNKEGTGASLQGDESEILETDDAKMIEETLAAKVSRFALAWKFGPDAPQLAYIKLRTTPRQNIQDDLAVDGFLSKFKGLLGKKATLERYGRPLPDEDEELLETSSAQPDPGTPGQDEPEQDSEFANADDAGGRWITTSSGAHVFIRDGETSDAAMERTFGAGHSEQESANPPSKSKFKVAFNTKGEVIDGHAKMIGHTRAAEGEYYHGTSPRNVESILKSGVKPLEKTLGFKAAFVGTRRSSAQIYGGAKALGDGEKEVAVLVFKNPGAKGALSPKGIKDLAYHPEGFKPETIDRIEYYTAGGPKDEKPLRVIHPSQFANEELKADLATTLHETILPILQRLEAISRVEDAAIQRQLLEKLLRDYPQLASAVQADNSLAKKLSPALEKSLLAGMNTKPTNQ